MSAALKLHNPNVIAIEDGALEDTIKPHIPAGEYVASFSHYETKRIFKTPKLFLHFEVIGPGPYCGTKLYCVFRASSLVGKEGKNGRFRVRTRSELFLTLCRLQPDTFRPDRISLRGFKGALFRVRVRTVEKDYLQRALPEFLRYSVVDSILSIEAGRID